MKMSISEFGGKSFAAIHCDSQFYAIRITKLHDKKWMSFPAISLAHAKENEIS